MPGFDALSKPRDKYASVLRVEVGHRLKSNSNQYLDKVELLLCDCDPEGREQRADLVSLFRRHRSPILLFARAFVGRGEEIERLRHHLLILPRLPVCANRLPAWGRRRRPISFAMRLTAELAHCWVCRAEPPRTRRVGARSSRRRRLIPRWASYRTIGFAIDDAGFPICPHRVVWPSTGLNSGFTSRNPQ